MENIKPRSYRNTIQAFLGLFMAGLITVGILFFRTTIETYEVLSYPSVFFISILGNATVIFPAPSYAIVFSGGAILNPYGIGIAAGLGAAIGELTGYLAGSSGKSVIIKNDLFTKIESHIQKRGSLTIFILALIPNPFFDIGGIIAGMTNMPIWKFFLAASTGKIIRFILLGFAGQFLLGK